MLNQKISTCSDLFLPISLTEMEEVALMNRTDTKFILHSSHIEPLLKSVSKQYRILEIDGKRIMSYSSLYFDTPKNKFYHDHHNGKTNRAKVRIRKYEVSDLYFLEVKQKNGKGRTHKSRIPLSGFETNFSRTSTDFIATSLQQDYDLVPTLSNSFKRLTLVNLKDKERVTLDRFRW